MYTRILTENERDQISKYLKKDGARKDVIRTLVMRAKRHRGTILEDLELLKDLVETYEQQKTR
jgi:hypothetical protein